MYCFLPKKTKRIPRKIQKHGNDKISFSTEMFYKEIMFTRMAIKLSQRLTKMRGQRITILWHRYLVNIKFNHANNFCWEQF